MKKSAPTSRRRINRNYFKQLLLDRKIKTRELASLADMHQASVVRALQGKQPLKDYELAKMAEILNVPLDEFVRNLGIDVPHVRMENGGKVPVTGSISAGKVVETVAGPRAVAAPPNESGAGMQALRYTDEGPLEGAYLYFRPAKDVPVEAIGKLCVCVVSGGEMWVGTPRVVQSGVYTLRDVMGRILAESIWIESASPVLWIKPV